MKPILTERRKNVATFSVTSDQVRNIPRNMALKPSTASFKKLCALLECTPEQLTAMVKPHHRMKITNGPVYGLYLHVYVEGAL